MKDMIFVIISIDAEKYLTEFYICSWFKTFDRIGMEGMHLDKVKEIYDNSTTNILNSKYLKALPLRPDTTQR